jgi:hypothetical protein
MEPNMTKFKISIHKTREAAIDALLLWIGVYNEEDMDIVFEFSTGLYALYIPVEG